MNKHRLADYLDHMQQAANDACTFVKGLSKAGFLDDRRTQQAVIMSLVIIGEAATKTMEGYPGFVQAHPELPWQHARHAKPHRPRVFRYQPRCGLGHHANRAAGPVEPADRRSA